MKKAAASVFSALFYLVTPALILFSVLRMIQNNLLFNKGEIFSDLVFGMVFLYFGSLMLSLFVFKENRRKIMKITFFAFFILYSAVLLDLTIFRYPLAEQLTLLTKEFGYQFYCAHSLNLIPFATISEYFHCGFGSEFIVNILGNLIAFMPFAFFLPLLFKKCRKFWEFLIVLLIINVAIEVLQLLLMVGSCDIDDVILNILGAAAAYGILHIKPIRWLINKLTLLEY